jgi:type II secretory pathway pseudopilin PulG
MSSAIARRNICFALLLLILSIFALFVIPSFKQQTLFAQKQSGFSVYENRIYNFTMEYPSDWKQLSPISFAYIVTFDAPTEVP